jgi:hypothetical protein
MAAARRRLRSGTVILGGVGTLAALLTSCGSEPDKRCVDRDSYLLAKGYRIVDAKECRSVSSGGSRKSLKRRVRDAAWYYGGKERNDWADDGSFARPSGSGSGGSGGSYDDDSGVSRGGFGHGSGSSGG